MCRLSQSTVQDDTIHYLSPASSRSVLGDSLQQLTKKCICGHPSCECFEESVKLTVISSEYEQENLERTLAIIKPEAVHYEDVIIRRIIKEGFRILSVTIIEIIFLFKKFKYLFE